MTRQNGKMTITSIITFLVLVYGGFAVFKIVKAELDKKGINKEIHETLSTIRGAYLTSSKAEQAILDILKKNNVEINDKDPNTVRVTIDTTRGDIHFSFKYTMVSDFVFFKRRQVVEHSDSMATYGF